MENQFKIRIVLAKSSINQFISNKASHIVLAFWKVLRAGFSPGAGARILMELWHKFNYIQYVKNEV